MVRLVRLRKNLWPLAPWIAYALWRAYNSNRERIDEEFGGKWPRYGTFRRALGTVRGLMLSPLKNTDVFAVMVCGWPIGLLSLTHNMVAESVATHWPLADRAEEIRTTHVTGTNVSYWFAKREARPGRFKQYSILKTVLTQLDRYLDKTNFSGTLWTVVQDKNRASWYPLVSVLCMQKIFQGSFPDLHAKPVSLYETRYTD